MSPRIFVVILLSPVFPCVQAQTVPPSVSLQRTAGGVDVELKFPSISGQNYRVFTSTSLTTGTWVDTNITAGGNGGEHARVVLGPPDQ